MLGYTRWSPFADLFALHREMSNALSRAFGMAQGTGTDTRTTAWVPPVESFYHNNKLIVRAWIPGVDPSTVDVQVSGAMLTIKGERTFPYALGEDQSLYTEVAYGPFERTLTLPEGAQSNHVTAKYTNGVLEIALPLHEGVLPKKVPIDIAAPAQPALAGTR
jgi:HSP20 family protein